VKITFKENKKYPYYLKNDDGCIVMVDSSEGGIVLNAAPSTPFDLFERLDLKYLVDWKPTKGEVILNSNTSDGYPKYLKSTKGVIFRFTDRNSFTVVHAHQNSDWDLLWTESHQRPKSVLKADNESLVRFTGTIILKLESVFTSEILDSIKYPVIKKFSESGTIAVFNGIDHGVYLYTSHTGDEFRPFTKGIPHTNSNWEDFDGVIEIEP